MKLNAEINGDVKTVEVTSWDGSVFARIDDREYALDASQIEPGLFHFKLGPKVYEIYVAPNGLVDVGPHQFEVRLVDPRSLRSSGAAGALEDGLVEIKTAMPGKVVRTLVAAGDEVTQGQGVVVVEAMKMQNELKSPKEGVVKEMRFSEGDTVNGGDVLAVIE